MTYPVRVGWHRFRPDMALPKVYSEEMSDPSKDEELGSFLQTWLFFGLLHGILSPCALYNEAHFIERDDQGGFVHPRNSMLAS